MHSIPDGPRERPNSFPDNATPLARLTAFGFIVCGSALLVLAVWLGGTRGWFGDRALQATAALMLVPIALKLGLGWSRESRRLPWQVWLTVSVLVAVPILAWLGLSSPHLGNANGAAQLRADLHLAGVDALAPSMAAEQALWSLLPALAIFFCALLAGARGRIWLLVLCVVLAIAEGMLAITQLAGRGFGWVRFTWPGGVEVFLGTFSNRNHLATLLLALLPLCVAQTLVGSNAPRSESTNLLRALWASAGVLLFTGIVASQSRSGLVLALIAMAAASAAVLGRKQIKRTLLPIGAIVAIWLMAGGSGLIQKTLERIADPAGTGARMTYLLNSVRLSQDFGVGGIGLGNFQRLYGAKLGDEGLERAAINHVHNDWAELVLETGWIGALALLILVTVFVRTGWRLWQGWQLRTQMSISPIPLAAWLGAAAIALHSLVDFPLRTTAVSCELALLMAVVFADGSLQQARSSHVERSSARRHRAEPATGSA